MLKIENAEVMGWEAAIRGMRNPKNSWEKSDSGWSPDWSYTIDPSVKGHIFVDSDAEGYFELAIGPNDQNLMTSLRNAGTDHRKFMRMITVYLDITAPLYWWKEFDTYKVGTVANSCSTMHKIQAKKFTFDDFSCEHLSDPSIHALGFTIKFLNQYRDIYNNWDSIDDDSKNTFQVHEKKDAWWQMIQLLPSSYNQKRTVMLNYEVLANIYKSRKDHKLYEWRILCDWIKSLPYSELITGEKK